MAGKLLIRYGEVSTPFVLSVAGIASEVEASAASFRLRFAKFILSTDEGLKANGPLRQAQDRLQT